jgi:hypothetical protein
VPPAWWLCGCVLWRGAGGQGEQRGGRNFLEEQRIISPPIHFLPLSTLPAPLRVSIYWLRALMKPPITLFCQHIFLIWQIYLITSLLSTQLPFSSHLLYPYLSHNFPRSRSSKTALPLLMIIPSTTECHKLGSFSL